MTEIQLLQIENKRLISENLRLKDMLKSYGVSFDAVSKRPRVEDIAKEQDRRIKLFMKLFCVRREFYAERWESKSGHSGYSPVCTNRWKSICPKQIHKSIKCYECTEQSWSPFTEDVAYHHLVGRDERGKPFVAGTYALLENSDCKFLVFDFDDHDGSNLPWKEEAHFLREICQEQGIDTALERSRSGKGAHVWIFFENPIPARLARKFGAALLAKGADTLHQRDFNTFDRMLPNQDELPSGGMGNLIALPLQGIPRKNGNSVFVDDDWNIVSDQWAYLDQIKLLSRDFVENKLFEWKKLDTSNVLVMEEDNISYDKPWEKKNPVSFEREDVTESIRLTLADCIYIPKESVKPRTMNRIRRMATFSNPQFYKMQAMRYSTKRISRRIQCFRDIEKYVTVPRGCLEELKGRLDSAGIPYCIEDVRTPGREIAVTFIGDLKPEQEKAAEVLLAHNIGIVGAATGFGKTVLGAYLIACRRVNTLILVHNREIMRGWLEDIDRFLQINEELPIVEGYRRRKNNSIVGTIYSGHDSLNGIIDVAMISSLGRGDSVDERVKDYGMVIMDECHHGGAYTFENVLWKVMAKYVYGLTATPVREDGHEKIVFMQLGPVRYRLSEKDRAAMQSFRHEIYPRFTGFSPVTREKLSINDLYKMLIHNTQRNQMLVEDILSALQDGRRLLVLTKFKEHVHLINNALMEKGIHPILLMGGGSVKEREERQSVLKQVDNKKGIVIIATGKYIGEGFNFPSLDTLFLTVPVSWKGNIAQYAGRIHRDYVGKENVVIYDYVDVRVKMLERMYQKRLHTYASMGYTVYEPTGNDGPNMIFTVKDYQEVFWQDFHNAAKRVCISAPRLSQCRVMEFANRLKQDKRSQMDFVIWTLPTDEYALHQRKGIDSMKSILKAAGADLRECESLNCHFAVMDEELVWYGSMNFLSKEHENDILMRLTGEAIVMELLAMVKGV